MTQVEKKNTKLNWQMAPGQGGVLHAVSELRFRWVGWSIACAVLVLALTFMSNRCFGPKKSGV